MIKIFFIIIILSIIFSNCFNDNIKTKVYFIEKKNNKENDKNLSFRENFNFKEKKLKYRDNENFTRDNEILSSDNENFSIVNEKFSTDNKKISGENDIKIWSKVNNNKYFINIKPLTLLDLTNWIDYIDETNIIDNLNFDPNIGEIILTSDNEDTAIVIAYLIQNNFNGTNNFEDSINLLDPYLEKIKNDKVFKNKLLSNLFNSLNMESYLT
jgi:hypothetical protein